MEGFQRIFVIGISMLSGQLLIENQRNTKIKLQKRSGSFFDKLSFLTEELKKVEKKVKFDLEERNVILNSIQIQFF